MKKIILTITSFLYFAAGISAQVAFPPVEKQQDWAVLFGHKYRHEKYILSLIGKAYIPPSTNTAWYSSGTYLSINAHTWGDEWDSVFITPPESETSLWKFTDDPSDGIYSYRSPVEGYLSGNTTRKIGITGVEWTFLGARGPAVYSEITYSFFEDTIPPQVDTTIVNRSVNWAAGLQEINLAYTQSYGPGVSDDPSSWQIKYLGGYVNGVLIASGSEFVSAVHTPDKTYFIPPHCGTYEITVSDRCGLTSEPVYIDVIDTTAPVQTITKNPQQNISSEANFIITVSKPQGSTGIKQTISCVGSMRDANGIDTPINLESSSVPNDYPPDTGLCINRAISFAQTGVYSDLKFTASGLDCGAANPSGHLTATPSTISDPYSFIILKDAPRITLDASVNEAGWYNKNNINIESRDDLGRTLDTQWYQVSSPTIIKTISANNPYLTLSDGSYQITFLATDLASNIGKLENIPVKIDTLVPHFNLGLKTKGASAFSPIDVNNPNYFTQKAGAATEASDAPNDGSGSGSSGILSEIFSYIDANGETAESTSFTSLLADLGKLPDGIKDVSAVLKDRAGNSASTTFRMIKNSIPPSMPFDGATRKYKNVLFIKSGVVENLMQNGYVASNAFTLSFAKGTDGKYNGSYAPPNSIAFYFDNNTSTTTTRVFTAAGDVYNTSVDLASTLADGEHVIHYTLYDKSGLSSTGDIEFVLRRTPPPAILASQVQRYSDDVSWSADSPVNGTPVWTISRSQASALVTGSTQARLRDGVRLDIDSYKASLGSGADYNDYSFIVQKDEGTATTAADGIYHYKWGSEGECALTIKVVNGAGVESTATKVVLVKPVWSGFDEKPVKQTNEPARGGFSIRWNEATTDPVVGNSIKKVSCWINDGQIEEITTTGTQAILDANDIPSQGGSRIGVKLFYSYSITESGGIATNVLGAKIVDQNDDKYIYTIPYDALSPIELPTDIQYLARNGALAEFDAYPRYADDGTAIHYALSLSTSIGSGTNSVIYETYLNPEHQGHLAFEYDLWSLIPNPPADKTDSNLKARLGSSGILAKIIASYDPAWTKASTILSVSTVERSLAWDFDAPTITYGGMMGSYSGYSTTKSVSGTASDVGGSHVAWVRVKGEALDGSGNTITPEKKAATGDSYSYTFNLTTAQAGGPIADGLYRLSIEAIDGAGNSFAGPSVDKLIDTKAPSLTTLSFMGTNGRESGSNAWYANTDGSIAIELRSDDSGGSGLSRVEYAWGASSSASPKTGWMSTAIPVGASGGAETRTISIGGATAGVSKLFIRLVDAAGNVSASKTDPVWLVSYDPSAPTIGKILLQGLRESGGSYYVKSAADLSAGYESPESIASADLRWNVVLVNADGTINEAASAWPTWGQSFNAVRSRISTDGQRYQVQLMARNANRQTGTVVSSEVFILDGTGPTGVGASIAGGGNSFVAGEPMRIVVTGSDSHSGLAWTWARQRMDLTGDKAIEESFAPGSDVAIVAPGTYRITLSAESGSGIKVSAPALSVTIRSDGLAVRDFQAWTDGIGVIGGGWSYTGGAPFSYQYRWTSERRGTLQDWRQGDVTMSALLDMKAAGIALDQGDSVRLEARALSEGGEIMAEATSRGCSVDLSGPSFGYWSAPQYISPRALWIDYQGSDSDSGIQSASLLVRRISPSGREAVWERSLAATSDRRRIDVDLGAAALATGDRLVVEVSLTNGAGLTATRASGIVTVDGTPPSDPIVIDMADAVRYKPSDTEPQAGYQRLSFQWDFSQPDAESGTVKYFWKAYANADDLAESAWTEAEPGSTTVSGLDYSASKYSGLGSYADGTVLRFAVKAVNGAGLSSVGYSRGIVLDSKAPLVIGVTACEPSMAPISGYVRAESLISNGKSALRMRISADDYESGLSQFVVCAGVWTTATGFAPVSKEIAFAFEKPSSGPIDEASLYSEPIGISEATPGSVMMMKGTVFDAAGNARVVYSPAFKVLGATPEILGIVGSVGPDELGFAWSVRNASDVIKDYRVELYRTTGGSRSILQSVQPLTTSASFDWKALGLAKGDSVECDVSIEFKAAGLGSGTSVASLVIAPDAPILAAFECRRYFSDHMNVDPLAYSSGDPQGGAASDVEEIQWRLRDARTGSLLQDWTADRTSRSTSVKRSFVSLAKAPVDGDRIYVEVRARSFMGIWSDVTPSQSIIVDASPPSGMSIARAGQYSNAPQGFIPAWTVRASDEQSGILAYQTIIARESEAANVAALDWAGRGTEHLAELAPGVALQAEVDVSFGEYEDGKYVAFLRVQNGTEDWSVPVMSDIVVEVDRVAPTISVSYAPYVIRTRNGVELATKITNADVETVGACSNKERTTFTVSLDGIVVAPNPTTLEGSNGQIGVKSFAFFDMAGPGVRRIMITGRDLYGNVASAESSLRFNEAPSVSILRTKTTPAQILDLERLVDVSDASCDYPMTYSWSLGGGTGVGYVDGTPYSGGPTAEWGSSAYHRALYLQSGKNQVTSYPLTLSVTDLWGKKTTTTVPIEVRNTNEGRLYTNEYWTGDMDIDGLIIVPAGITLTLDGASAKAKGGLSGGFLTSGISIESGGAIIVANGENTTSSIVSGTPGYRWRGIKVYGGMEGSGLLLADAERALTLEPGGTISLVSAIIESNLIGLHLLGGTLALTTSDLRSNGEYGVKEDGSGTYAFTNDRFSANAVDYYEAARSVITLDELNALGGNAGNERN